MSRKINNTAIPSDYTRRFTMDWDWNSDTGSWDATVTNWVWGDNWIWYKIEGLQWWVSTTFTYSSVTFTNSYIFKDWVFIKNSAEVTSTALNWVNWSNYDLLTFFNRTLTNSEEGSLKQEGLRQLWPTNLLNRSQGFPKYSLRSLEVGKVLEISKPANSWVYYDQTGNGNNWTPTNVTDSTVGLNNVMSFNWTSSYVSIPHSTELASDDFTIWIRFNSNNFTSWNRRIVWKDAGWNTNWDWQLRMDDTTKMQVVFQAQNWGGEIKLLSWITSSDVWKWCDIMVIWTSSWITIYVDWIETDTASFTWSNANNSNAIQLWRHSTSWSNFFDWEMSNFTYHNRALSDTEIQQDYYSSKLI